MYHIVCNPASRSGKALGIWQKVVEPTLKAEGVPYQVHFSTKAGEITDIVKKITAAFAPFDEKAKLTLLIMGGDGTMNEAIQGIVHPKRVLLGCIPTGSSNDLLRHISMPRDPKEAVLHLLHHATPHGVDLGEVTLADGTTRRFLLSCGMGLDAEVCAHTVSSKVKGVCNKLCLGKLCYSSIALGRIFGTKLTSCQFAMDEEAPITLHRFWFVVAMIHTHEGGGFAFCPAADHSDGLFDICAVGDLSRFAILRALPAALLGKHLRFANIESYRSKTLHITTEAPLYVHTDGEPLPATTEVTMSCLPQAITLLY